MSKINYKWKLVFGNPDKDHSYWLDRNSGRISLKDESGDLPHLTDDGVLWLDTHRPIVIEEYGRRSYAFIPLYCVRSEDESTSPTSLYKALRLADRFHMNILFKGAFLNETLNSMLDFKQNGKDLTISFI